MPSTSEKQRRFMGMEYGKAKEGKKTETGMNIGQLRDFAKGPVSKPPKKSSGRNPNPRKGY